MTLKYRTLTTITAVGMGLALGWGLGTQQIKAQAPRKAPAKNWKSQAEFDLYDAFQKAKGKEKIAALDKWKRPFRKAISRLTAKRPTSARIKNST